MADNRVDIREVLVQAMLNDIDGPVGQMLKKLTDDMARIAREKAPVREGNTWSRKSDARLPGFTKARIRTKVVHDGHGKLFGEVGAPADPALFLEKPAFQMHAKHPFLTTALWTVPLD